jgi:hypothetical protein
MHIFVSVRNVAIAITLIVSVITIISDTLFGRIIAFISFSSLNIFSVYVIPAFVAIFIITQYILLGYVRRRISDKSTSNSSLLKAMLTMVTFIQFLISVPLTLVAVEIAFQSRYDLILLKIVLWLSYGMSIILLALLAAQFFKWLKSNYNIVVLAYAIAMGTLSLSVIIHMLYVSSDLEAFPDEIRPVISAVMIYDNPERPLATFSVAISVISFVMTWLATTLLLRHHSRKLGRIKYWIAITLPLIYFLGQFQSVFLDVFSNYRFYDSVLFGLIYTVIFALAKPLGGFLFGVAFWIMARKIQNLKVKDYLLISGSGFLLLFASDQAGALILNPYPPFGLVSISYMGLASCFILLGIYLTAVSVSKDERLRMSIRKTIETEYDMLERIAVSQMNEEIQRRVLQIYREVGADKLPAEPEPSLSEAEVQQYIDKVLQEVRKDKKK